MNTSNLYYEKERKCRAIFDSLGNVFQGNTPENFEIIFTCEQDFLHGQAILAICVMLFPEVRLIAFQLMSNHIHLVLTGNPDDIMSMFALFKTKLARYLASQDRCIDLKNLNFKLFPIVDIEAMRNFIAYVHRNSFVVNDDITPLTYRWGSNEYYFQSLSRKYYFLIRKNVKNAEIRKLFHGKQADRVRNLYMVDGIVSAMSFCDIELGESIYHDAKQYFFKVSRNVESYSQIAKLLGESIFYSDEDLYSAVRHLSEKMYDQKDPRILSSNEKMTLAQKMHYDFNASDKQIARILSLDIKIINQLFL